MKKVLAALGILAVIVIAAAVIVPGLVPAEKIRDEMVAQVKAATGRDLSIDGKMAVSLFPTLSVQVANVALSNPPGFTTRDLVRLGAVDVRLKLMPMLVGRIEVDSFVLLDPVISLETDRHGRANWVFDQGKPADKAKSGGGSAGAVPLSDIRLGNVRIANGRLTYADGKTGAKEEVSDVNLAIGLPGLDSPLTATGGLRWHGKLIELTLDVARPRALLEGKATDAGVAVAAEPVKFAFKGSVESGVTGDLELAVPNLRGLAQWVTGKPLDAPGIGLGPLSITGRLAAAGAKVSFSDAVLRLDAIKAAGDLAVDTGGARPAVKGRLAVETLDVNPYLPPEGQGSKAAGTRSTPAHPAAAKSDWSDEPLDASALKAADVDLTLSAQAIRVQAIQVGKTALRVVIKDGRLAADLTELALYQGAGSGRLAVDGSAPGVGLDAVFSLKGLKAEPFLKDAAGFDRLDGTASAEIHLAGKGRSQRQLVSDLDGTGRVDFLDGSIRGINLASMVRNVASAFTATDRAAEKTDFAELGGSFVIKDGLLTNKDLALKSPLLRVEGAGSVDLPRRTVTYRVEPKLSATLEGQGGQSDVAGVTVPVVVEGPWDNLTYRPDLAGMVKDGVGKALDGALAGKAPALPTMLPGMSGMGGPLSLDPKRLFGR